MFGKWIVWNCLICGDLFYLVLLLVVIAGLAGVLVRCGSLVLCLFIGLTWYKFGLCLIAVFGVVCGFVDLVGWFRWVGWLLLLGGFGLRVFVL